MEQNRNSFTPGAATDEPVPSIHFSSQAEADAYRAGIAEGERRARGGDASPPPPPGFDPVPLRYRRDGWTPERQVALIRAIAECGCVVEACRRVGMSPESAYELARRPDAQSFRIAWDIAMDNAVRRVGDGAFSRALNGVEIPHYYKGELVGTHRRFDERLTMFILRTRDPLRFGREAERAGAAVGREDRALDLGDSLAWVRSDAEREQRGKRRTVVSPPAAPDDENGMDGGEAAGRPLTHVYDFAPGAAARAAPEAEPEPEDAAAEALDEEVEAELDEILGWTGEDAVGLDPDVLEEAAWAKVRAAARADSANSGLSEPEIEATIAFVRRRSSESSPPDVSRASSTSAPPPSFPRTREPSGSASEGGADGKPALDSRFRGNDGEGEAGGADPGPDAAAAGDDEAPS